MANKQTKWPKIPQGAKRMRFDAAAFALSSEPILLHADIKRNSESEQTGKKSSWRKVYSRALPEGERVEFRSGVSKLVVGRTYRLSISVDSPSLDIPLQCAQRLRLTAIFTRITKLPTKVERKETGPNIHEKTTTEGVEAILVFDEYLPVIMACCEEKEERGFSMAAALQSLRSVPNLGERLRNHPALESLGRHSDTGG